MREIALILHDDATLSTVTGAMDMLIIFFGIQVNHCLLKLYLPAKNQVTISYKYHHHLSVTAQLPN